MQATKPNRTMRASPSRNTQTLVFPAGGALRKALCAPRARPAIAAVTGLPAFWRAHFGAVEQLPKHEPHSCTRLSRCSYVRGRAPAGGCATIGVMGKDTSRTALGMPTQG